MVNIQVFIKALRETWSRRVIQNHKKCLGMLSGIDFQKVFFPWD